MTQSLNWKHSCLSSASPAAFAKRSSKGDVVCGLLEAFKTRTLHYDQDKKRFSMKESSTTRDSGSVENIIKSLIAARWPHTRNVA